MMGFEIKIDNVFPFVKWETIAGYEQSVHKELVSLHNNSGKGSDFMGWINLPSSVTEELFAEMELVANELRGKIEVMVVIGIGGSYLGAKAVIDALKPPFEDVSSAKQPVIIFAGQNLSEDYMSELLRFLDSKSYAITVISKSGTTTEPAVAFRILRNHLEKKYGLVEAVSRIVAITSKDKGALKEMADSSGYKTFIIPDDVGGRFSVLTPVGLFPLVVAGIEVRKIVAGAIDMEIMTRPGVAFEQNPASIYAATRNALYERGYRTEILASYEPGMVFMAEWWKQLFGESEGKENKGIFPASVNFTADLHSMGQYLQEGQRNLFETVISIDNTRFKVEVPFDSNNADGLNFLAGMRIDDVNKMAELGTTIAHVDGGVPVISIKVDKLDPYSIGRLIYFFEKACAISGYLLGVNPFDQPGVEAYKNNMYALLKKPGFEKETETILNRLGT